MKPDIAPSLRGGEESPWFLFFWSGKEKKGLCSHTAFFGAVARGLITLKLALLRIFSTFAAVFNTENMTEREKMLAGQLYDACDEEVITMLNVCKDQLHRYNSLLPSQLDERREMLFRILGQCDEHVFINQPFYCDYGKHIRVGKRFFANFHLTILDEAYVTIGDDAFIGPNVSIYTACHSTDPVERNSRREWAKPVTIGNNCWIGGSVTILAGVTIGDNCTIGAGSVVVHDIPSGSVAVGNPCRVIKTL